MAINPDALLEELDNQTLEEDDTSELPPSDIVAYSELRSCADLYRMYEDGLLDLTPEFQREEVWKNPGKSRFIDSLIKQLPIPSLCFAYDYKTEHRQVIDGLQRISAIIKFLKPDPWTLSRIGDIDPKIAGRSNAEFKDKNSDLHAFYRRIQNATLPITVLRCDTSNKRHQSYLFTIFHRLNTGGLKLNNQEIRNCIYQGPFNSLLRRLASHATFRTLLGFSGDDVTRFKVEELILRFFAYFERRDLYTGRLASFLNDYMSDKRIISDGEIARLETIATNTASVVVARLPEFLDGRRKTLAVVEAVLVGIGVNLERLKHSGNTSLKPALEQMLMTSEFSEDRLRGGIADADKVKGRLSAAIAAFATI